MRDVPACLPVQGCLPGAPEVGGGWAQTSLSWALGVGCLGHVGDVFGLSSSPGGSRLGGQFWGLQQGTCNPSHAFLPQLLFHL